MRTEGYRFLDHVTDAVIEAWGPNLEKALAQAGLGFFETMIEVSKVRPQSVEHIEATGHDELELVYNWLEQLLLSFEIRRLVFSKFMVSPVESNPEGFRLEARASGELYDPVRHGRKVEVKGVTYHGMTVQRGKGRVSVQFLLDL